MCDKGAGAFEIEKINIEAEVFLCVLAITSGLAMTWNWKQDNQKMESHKTGNVQKIFGLAAWKVTVQSYLELIFRPN